MIETPHQKASAENARRVFKCSLCLAQPLVLFSIRTLDDRSSEISVGKLIP